MHSLRRQEGMTLVELVVVLALIAVISAFVAPQVAQWRSNVAVKAAARDIGDLFSVARAEAIRTGTNHIVYIWRDAGNNVLTGANGAQVAALLTSDDNGDGLPQAAEFRASVPLDSTGAISWGVSAAAAVGSAPTDPDPNNSFTSGWTFRDPGNNTTSWVVFWPDGIPRGFTVTPAYDDGGAAGLGNGGGGIYVTNGRFDYAVVLSPLGGVRVHPFNPVGNAWRN